MKGINIQPGATCFVDTNIWLYSFIETHDVKKTEIAKSIVSGSDIVIKYTNHK